MKIVVLDGWTLNPGDLDWSIFGDIKVYDNSAPDEIVERVGLAEIVISNKIVWTKELFEKLPNLKYIAVTATGYNTIDLVAAKNANVKVSNVPSYCTDSVAQLNLALLLQLAINVSGHDSAVKNGLWASCKHFCFQVSPIVELTRKTAGFIGFGNIGQKSAKILHELGLNIIYYNHREKELQNGVIAQAVSLDDVISKSDVIFLACPMNAETDKIVNEKFLSKMKKSAFLINTSRGGLVNEDDLASALNNEKIAGYATDVLSCEPPKSDNKLISAKNTIITPHIAWQSFEARKRLFDETFKNVESFILNKPRNLIY